MEKFPAGDSNKKEGKKKLVFRAGVSPKTKGFKLGPLRAHAYNYSYAKSEALKGNDSSIILRMDDTDKEKHSKGDAARIVKFFSELGMEFDVTPENSQDVIGQSIFQSERQDVYRRYLVELYDKGIAFVDKDSGLALFDIEKFMNEYSDTLEINDSLMGLVKFKLEENLKRGQKFFPLIRSDQSVLYHFASTVDDAELGVTNIVRGIDKLPATQFQEMVRVALGLDPKEYLHTPILLSKKDEVGTPLRFNEFVSAGYIPQALVSYMISSGYGDPSSVYTSLSEFIENFDVSKIHHKNAKFDLQRLNHINKEIAKKLDPETYLNSLFIYLDSIGKHEYRERLSTDTQLAELIVSLRRLPSESVRLIEQIVEPRFSEVDQTNQETIAKVIAELETNKFSFPESSAVVNDLKTLQAAVRWILTGQIEFPKIKEVYQYLKDANLLQERINMAKDFLIKS